MRRRWIRVRWLLLILLLLGAARPVSAADYTEASIRHLRRAVTPQRGGTHLLRLASLRNLHDPTLRPLFYQIAQTRDWQMQVHAILGLAELDESRHVDPWLVTQIDEQAQETLIANAIDMDLIGVEQIRELLEWNELQPMSRLLLLAELQFNGAEMDREEVERLSGSANYDVAGLAAILLAQAGDLSKLSGYADRLEALPRRDRDRHRLWLLEAIRQYETKAALPWVQRLLEAPDLDDEVAYWGLFTALVLDAPTGLPIWTRQLGDAPAYREKVRYGMLLLAAGPDISVQAYDLIEGEEALLERMVDAGRARSAGTDPVDALIALIDLGHVRTSDWAMGVVRKLPDPESARVCIHLAQAMDRQGPGGAERAARAIEAASRLFAIDHTAVERLLAQAEDDSLAQEVLLLGLIDTRDPAAGEIARTIRRIGAGRADSLALLLLAQHADTLDSSDLERLGRIAGGGGRVSEGLQIQAAWLYLKHAGAIDRALTEIFRDSS